MPIDDDAKRGYRVSRSRDWAIVRVRARAKAAPTPSARPVFYDHPRTRKQVASRVQSAAGEALAALRRQRED